MAIELADGVTMKNGALQISGAHGTASAPVPPKQQRYIMQLNTEIAEMTLAESELNDAIAETQQRIDDSKDGRELRQLKAQVKTARSIRAEAAIKQRGVIESFLESIRPGTKLRDLVLAAINSDAKPAKQLTNGRGGKRK